MIHFKCKAAVLAICLTACRLVAEEPLSGGAFELDQARLAIQQENYREALRRLAVVQIVHYRDESLRPAALFYEALVDVRTGSSDKKVSALDELKALYPDSEWCRRANELKMTEIKEGGE